MYIVSFTFFIAAFFCDQAADMWLMLLASASLLMWAGALDLIKNIDGERK